MHKQMLSQASLLVAALIALGHVAHAQSIPTQAQMFLRHDATVGYYGDWAYGYWKGDCGYDTPIALGMSFSPFGGGATSAVLCGGAPYTLDGFEHYTLWMNNGDDRLDTRWGDWAYGQYKAECGPTDMLVGIAQDATLQNPSREAALCVPTEHLSQPTYCYPVYSHTWMPIGSTPAGWQSDRVSTTGGDWGETDPMLQCADNEYVKGVSRGATGQSPVILCCGGNRVQ